MSAVTLPFLAVLLASSSSSSLLAVVVDAYQFPTETIAASRNGLLSFAENLNERRGPFLASDDEGKRLNRMVAELEAVCEPPTDADALVGDWKLLCTTTTEGRPSPSLLEKKSDSSLSESLRKSLDVVQRIRRKLESESSTSYDRVDNVIEFAPPTLTDALPFDVPFVTNPLEVTKTKVALIHKAELESVSPVLRTKIVLESIVLTVAGKSRFLEPEGADVLGLNLPFGDLFNFGSFDTTYADESLRISRGKIGFAEKLRVFVRNAPLGTTEATIVTEDDVSTTTLVEEEEVSSEDTTSSNEGDGIVVEDESTDTEEEKVEIPEEIVAAEEEKDTETKDGEENEYKEVEGSDED